MQSVASRELRNRTRWLLDRVATGERITITVDGRPVAILSPLGERRRWMPRDMFIRNLLANQADPALGRELDSLAPDTTDELPL